MIKQNKVTSNSKVKENDIHIFMTNAAHSQMDSCVDFD